MAWDSVLVDLISESALAHSRARRRAAQIILARLRGQQCFDGLADGMGALDLPHDVREEAEFLLARYGQTAA